MCKCGCQQQGTYLMTGFAYDPSKPNSKGERYEDEPACWSAVHYCCTASAELDFPFHARLIGEGQDTDT